MDDFGGWRVWGEILLNYYGGLGVWWYYCGFMYCRVGCDGVIYDVVGRGWVM